MKSWISTINNKSFEIATTVALVCSMLSYIFFIDAYLYLVLITFVVDFIVDVGMLLYIWYKTKEYENHMAMFTMSQYGIISSFIMTIFLLFSFGPFMLLPIAAHVLPETKYVKKCKHRGYYIPTKKNKMKHMTRLLSGELTKNPEND